MSEPPAKAANNHQAKKKNVKKGKFLKRNTIFNICLIFNCPMQFLFTKKGLTL